MLELGIEVTEAKGGVVVNPELVTKARMLGKRVEGRVAEDATKKLLESVESMLEKLGLRELEPWVERIARHGHGVVLLSRLYSTLQLLERDKELLKEVQEVARSNPRMALHMLFSPVRLEMMAFRERMEKRMEHWLRRRMRRRPRLALTVLRAIEARLGPITYAKMAWLKRHSELARIIELAERALRGDEEAEKELAKILGVKPEDVEVRPHLVLRSIARRITPMLRTMERGVPRERRQPRLAATGVGGFDYGALVAGLAAYYLLGFPGLPRNMADRLADQLSNLVMVDLPNAGCAPAKADKVADFVAYVRRCVNMKREAFEKKYPMQMLMRIANEIVSTLRRNGALRYAYVLEIPCATAYSCRSGAEQGYLRAAYGSCPGAGCDVYMPFSVVGRGQYVGSGFEIHVCDNGRPGFQKIGGKTVFRQYNAAICKNGKGWIAGIALVTRLLPVPFPRLSTEYRPSPAALGRFRADPVMTQAYAFLATLDKTHPADVEVVA